MPGKTGGVRPPPGGGRVASMRPQRNAGENGLTARLQGLWRRSFNEAPAKCRGKRREVDVVFPIRRSFNEAPAKCRGKRAGRRSASGWKRRFNEAPAKCRGKQRNGIQLAFAQHASMRPQRNAGENGVNAVECGARLGGLQ